MPLSFPKRFRLPILGKSHCGYIHRWVVVEQGDQPLLEAVLRPSDIY